MPGGVRRSPQCRSCFEALAVTRRAATRPSRSTVARSVISITSSTSCDTKIALCTAGNDGACDAGKADPHRDVAGMAWVHPKSEGRYPSPGRFSSPRSRGRWQARLAGRETDRPPSIWIERNAIGVETGDGLASLANPVDRQRPAPRQASDQHVLKHRQRRDQSQMLMHEADAVLAERSRRQRHGYCLSAISSVRRRDPAHESRREP